MPSAPKSLSRSLIGFSLLLLATSASARDLPTSSPQRQGMSADRLARIDTHMNQAVVDGVMVGGMGMIARDGKIVCQHAWGLADREARELMTEDTIFRIYSMSKPVTSVALMMLYEEGRFFLNDPVAKYLPELANLQLALSSADGRTGIISDGTSNRGLNAGDESKTGQTRAPMHQPTIRDLLRHTAGMTYGIFGDTEVDRLYREAGMLQQASLEEFVTDLGKLPLQYEPGSRWHYSVSVDAQGRLIEVLSGMSFGEFLKTRLLDPIGMVDTSFIVPEKKWERVAQIYSPEGTQAGFDRLWIRSTSQTLVPADDAINRSYRVGSSFESGGGGLVSTAEDYMRFALMLINGGEFEGQRYLSPKTIELMSANHLGSLPMGWGRAGWGFGLGFGVQIDPALSGEVGSAGEYNWGGAAGTRFWIDPQEKLVGLFMVQSIPHQTRLVDQFKVLTYQALTELE